MNLTRCLLFSISVAALSGCSPRSSAPPADSSGLTAWAGVPAEDINVPDGVSYTQATAEGVTFAEIGGVVGDATSTGNTGGVSIRLPAAFEAQASGARVQVTVRASAPQDGAVMGVAYSTAEVGNSGWQRFTLATAPRDYVFAYDVAPMQAGNGDYLGFRSYGANTVQIVGYKVEIVPPHAPAAATP